MHRRILPTLALICLACLLTARVHAEELYKLGWSRHPVGLQSSVNLGNAITMDEFGSLYVVGNTGGGTRSMLLKFDQSGNQLWAREYGDISGTGATAVATDAAGNIFVGSQNLGMSSLTKWDSFGNQLWEATYAAPNYLGEAFEGLAVDASGAAYAVSDASSSLTFKKFDAGGTELWSRSIDRTSVGSVTIDSEGDLYVACMYSTVTGAGRDAMVLKFDSAGNELWRNSFGGNGTDLPADIAVHPSGDIYLAGSTVGSLGGPNAGATDAFLARLDAGGEVVWIQQVGGAIGDAFTGITFDELGRAIVTGTGFNDIFPPSLGQRDALLAVYDTDGTRVWDMQLGSNRTDSSRGIVRAPNGAIYITGDLGSQSTSAWVQQLVPVPEPSTYALGAFALLGLLAFWRSGQFVGSPVVSQ